MAGAVLAPADRAHFLAMMRRQTNSAVHRRMNALLLLDDGWSAERVAAALFIDAETVREHLRRYTAQGRAGIERPGYVWKRPKVVPAKADEAAQRAFLAQTLRPLMAAAAADPAERLLFVDATHPAYDAHPAVGWIRRGRTATLKSSHGRVNVTLNGASAGPTARCSPARRR